MNLDLQKIVKVALYEDIPHGDCTTDALNLSEKKGRARVVAKEDLVLSGQEVFEFTFQQMDPTIRIEWHFRNGDFILKKQTICTLIGPVSGILKAERVALNFLGRLSGVATLTRCYVNEVKHTSTKILDTRKTTPGLRELEKQAVRDGGGHNHRMSLSDAILIKENHIRLSGGIKNAVNLIRKQNAGGIEVEVSSLAEVREALEVEIHRLLLDNMSNSEMAEVLKIIPATIKTEASGNMTLERVRSVAELGVDFISVGAITHSAPCADISLLLDAPEQNLSPSC